MLALQFCHQDSPAPQQHIQTRLLYVDQRCVGCIVGTRGDRIRAIQQQHNVLITSPKPVAPEDGEDVPQDSLFVMSGMSEDVKAAAEEIKALEHSLLNHRAGLGTPPPPPHYHHEQKQHQETAGHSSGTRVWVRSRAAGAIIGRSRATLNAIMETHAVTVEVGTQSSDGQHTQFTIHADVAARVDAAIDDIRGRLNCLARTNNDDTYREVIVVEDI